MTDDEKMDRQEQRKLQDVIRPIIDGARGDIVVSPRWVAMETMSRIDPQNLLRRQFPLAFVAANMTFREIAMKMLREKYESPASSERMSPARDVSPQRPAAEPKVDYQPLESEPKQLRLPGFELLQHRYPKPDGSGYVRLEDLTPEDAEWNAVRLERAGRTAIAHAEQLRLWVSNPSRAKLTA